MHMFYRFTRIFSRLLLFVAGAREKAYPNAGWICFLPTTRTATLFHFNLCEVFNRKYLIQYSVGRYTENFKWIFRILIIISYFFSLMDHCSLAMLSAINDCNCENDHAGAIFVLHSN